MDIDMDTLNEDVNDTTTVYWRLPILRYLTGCTFSDDKWESRRLKTRSAHYVVMDEKPRWTATKVLLTCIHGEKTRLRFSLCLFICKLIIRAELSAKVNCVKMRHVVAVILRANIWQRSNVPADVVELSSICFEFCLSISCKSWICEPSLDDEESHMMVLIRRLIYGLSSSEISGHRDGKV
ncbi:hypothetical protein Bca101_031170 [Brassica carinata]